ncbi:MAG TPA: hypothetical protein VM600_09210, partial [Actinomycetota bacterium]|nr:hypothetical protein [Actinomycetota bacterium]
ARGVQYAHAIFDSPNAQPVTLTASDGSFGGTSESLVGTITVPAGLPAGGHTVWVRAYDGTTWGAASVGVLSIDGRAPTISGLGASNSVRAAGQALTVTFDASDDVSSTVSFGVEVRNSATNKVMYSASRYSVPTGAQRHAWLPALDVPAGHYRIKVAVADESGNVSTAEAGTLVT